MPNALMKLQPQAVVQWSLLSLLMISSVLILPLGSNPLETGKLLSLFMLAVLTLWAFAAQVWRQPIVKLSTHPLLISLIALGLTTAVSTLFASSHPLSQLTGFSGTWLGFFVIAIVGGWLLGKKVTNSLVSIIVSMGSIATVFVILEVAGVQLSSLYSFLLGLPLTQGVGFNPTGSLFVVAQLCLWAVIASISAAQHTPSYKNLFFAGAAVNVVGLALAGWLCLPGKPANPVVLPWAASWSVALDALRNPRTALIGVGPDTYGNAYSQFKPSWMNTTPWWNVEFTQASTLPFTILTSQGVISFLIWVYFSVTFFRERKKLFHLSPVATITAGVGLLLVWLVPPTTFIMSVWATSLAFLIAETKDGYSSLEAKDATITIIPATWWQKVISRVSFAKPHNNLAPKIIMVSTAGLLGLVILVATIQLARAEFKQFQASQQTQKGNYVQLYELQKDSIAINPYNDVNHRNYALTNLAIASAVSNKADLNDEDMQKIAVLVQQSIREAKAAVLINPQKAQNWEVLGDIYTNFIGAMDGSDVLALEAYRQAIQYSPANPNLYIKLGGVFYRQGKYSEAILAFEQAALAKPDLANAYYNAANAFRELKDYSSAENAYKQTLVVLEQAGGSTSDQYLKANLELEELQKQSATSSATTTGTSN